MQQRETRTVYLTCKGKKYNVRDYQYNKNIITLRKNERTTYRTTETIQNEQKKEPIQKKKRT